MKGLCAVLTVVIAGVCVQGQGVVPGIKNRCFEPAEPGICRAFIPSFYFNPLSGSCDCFVYGGCRGNNNRFSSLQECMKTCSVRPELQFNTPACDRNFGPKNPLSSFPHSPHQTATNDLRKTTAAPQTQPEQPQPQSTGIELPPSTISSQPAEETEQPTATQAPAAPQTERPATPATNTNGDEDSESSSSSSSSSNTAPTKGIASIVIGTTGVRPGFLTIGQPVVVNFGKAKQNAAEEEKEE